MRSLIIASITLLAVGCPKKKEAPQPVYKAPEIEWPADDEDINDLPEAGEDDSGDKL